jgi:hypothetical protein
VGENEAMGDKISTEKFLRNFKTKMKIFDVLFLDDRGKNVNALARLEITPIARKKVLESLKVEDYSDGPFGESMHGGRTEMWVFGRVIRSQEIYIKITMGILGSAVICISFHIAEHPLKYPFQAGKGPFQGDLS